MRDSKQVICCLPLIELSPAGYTRATGVAFNRQVLDRLSALPGVESVTLADFSPLSFSIHSDYLQIEGYVPQPHEWMEISRAIVGPGYFRTLRTSVTSGRKNSGGEERPGYGGIATRCRRQPSLCRSLLAW